MRSVRGLAGIICRGRAQILMTGSQLAIPATNHPNPEPNWYRIMAYSDYGRDRDERRSRDESLIKRIGFGFGLSSVPTPSSPSNQSL